MRACKNILAHITEIRALSGPHMSFAKKGKAAHFDSLFTGDGLREMLEGKGYHAVDVVFTFMALLTGESHGFRRPCELSLRKVQYRDIINKVPVDQRNDS